MSGNVGKLNIKITGDSAGLNQALTAASAQTQAFATKTTAAASQIAMSSERMGGGFKNSSFAIQQLAIGAQDAASVIGTSGLSGALRASGNNIVQFASLLNPVAGTLAAVALTGGQLLLDYFSKQDKEATKAAEGLNSYATAAEEMSLRIARAADVTAKELHKLDRKKGQRELETESPEDIAKKLQTATDEIEEGKVKRAGKLRELHSLTDKYVPAETLSIPDFRGHDTFSEAVTRQEEAGNTIDYPEEEEFKKIQELLEEVRQEDEKLAQLSQKRLDIEEALPTAEKNQVDTKGAEETDKNIKKSLEDAAKNVEQFSAKFSKIIDPIGAEVSTAVDEYQKSLDAASRTLDQNQLADFTRNADAALKKQVTDFGGLKGLDIEEARARKTESITASGLTPEQKQQLTDDVNKASEYQTALSEEKDFEKNKFRERDVRLEAATQGSSAEFQAIQKAIAGGEAADKNRDQAMKLRERTVKALEDINRKLDKQPLLANF